MTRAKKERPTSGFTFRKLFQYSLVLLTGGGAGAGGWHFRDTLLGRSIVTVRESPEGEFLAEKVEARFKTALSADSFHQEGVFEVRLDRLAIDKDVIKPAHAESIQVFVVKRTADGRKTTVWDSKKAGKIVSVVEDDAITTGWQDSPFQVEWIPGDEIWVEVWEHKGLIPVRLFELADSNSGGDKPVFPLKTGTHAIEYVARGTAPDDPQVSQIVLKSRRISDIPGRPQDTAAASRVTRGDDDTISIK